MSSKFGVSDQNEVLITKAYRGILTSTIATSKKQRDIYLNEEIKVINFTNEAWEEIVFDIYKDGLFSLSNSKQKSEIVISLNYRFVENRCHLPFYLKVMVETNDSFINSYYGHFNETSIYVNLIADVSLSMQPRVFVKKIFNDVG